MRKFTKVMLLTLCVAILACGTYALAADITVKVDDKPVVFDVQPTIIADRTMVPLRAIFEAMNAQISWDGETKTIYAAKGDKIMVLQIDNKTAFVNSKEVVLDAAPTIIDGRTLVPTRFIGESLGAKVEWDDATKTVVITTAVAAPSDAPAASPVPEEKKKLTADEAYKLIGTKTIFIDVRTPDEYANGHIKGSINIPYDVIGEKIAAAVPDKSSQIVVYCKSGKRAGMAEETLKGLGYTDISNIGGVDNFTFELEK